MTAQIINYEALSRKVLEHEKNFRKEITFKGLPDRPFYEIQPISLTMDTSKEFVEIMGLPVSSKMYLQTEETYTVEQLVGAKLVYGTDEAPQTRILTQDDIEASDDGVRIFIPEAAFTPIYIVYNPPYSVSDALVFNKKGVYFTKEAESLGNKYTHSLSREGVLKQMEGKFVDSVVPDKNTSERGTPGVIAMYNESSGLRLDGDGRLCIAPAKKFDIDEGTSNNKPIVPAFMPYALQRFGDNFKVAVVPRNGEFQIKPGMIALLFPWKSYGTIYNPAGSSIIDTKGTSIIFATDPINTDSVMDTNGTQYQVAAISISGITSSSSHDTYSISSGYCYFKNIHSDTSGSGYAYVYYLG